MKKSFTRAFALLLLFAAVFSFGVRDSASAADYPYIHFNPNPDEEDHYVGEIVAINIRYAPAYKNEKYQFDIYGPDGSLVYSVTHQYRNSSTGFKSDVVGWNSKGAAVGRYDIVITKYFYSFNRWNEAPTTTNGHFDLKDPSMKPRWVQDSNGKWWYKMGNSYPKDQWMQIDGKWYHFDADGYMQTGWQQLNGKWYYFGTNGVMQTGWVKSGSSWYYFNDSGAMVTGWQQIDGKWYYFASSGAMKTGWVKDGGKWYYMDSSGAMVISTSKKIGSKTYKFDKHGVCLNP